MKDLLNLRKDRDVGMALSDTLSFIGQNFKPFAKVILFLAAPFYLIGSLISAWSQYQMADTVNGLNDINNVIEPDDLIDVYLSFPWATLSASMLFQILASAVMTACVFLFIRLYEQNFHNEANGLEKAKEITVSDVSSELWAHIPWVFGYTIIWTLMLMVGFIFLIIPGIFFGVATSLLFAVYFLENKGFSESMSRSMELVRNNWWRTLGFFLLLGIVVSTFNLVVSFPLGLITGGGALLGATEITTTTIVAQTITTFLSSMLYTVFTVGSGIWYYSLLEKKEAVSLENKIGRIGGEYDEDMFR